MRHAPPLPRTARWPAKPAEWGTVCLIRVGTRAALCSARSAQPTSHERSRYLRKRRVAVRRELARPAVLDLFRAEKLAGHEHAYN
jgi:hypothetical protein